MRRSSLLVLLFVTGCTQERVQPVFVDFDLVREPGIGNLGPVPAPGAVNRATRSLELSGEPSRTIAGAETTSRRREITELLSANRARAVEALAKRLMAAYRAEVDASEREMMDRYRDEQQGAWGDLVKSHRLIFDAYSAQRSPKVVRLALLVDHPDIDPNSTRSQDEAKSIREDLRRIEQKYRADVDALGKQIDSRLADRLIELRVNVAKLREEADRKAIGEARATVGQETANLDNVAAVAGSLTLGGTKSAGAKTSPSPSFGPPPKPIAEDARIQRRKDLEVEAKVWAATAGYALSNSKTDPDKTQEFIQWKEKRRAGP